VSSFEAFFRDYYDETVRAVALAIGSRDRAEEVVQEAFAKAYSRWRLVRMMDRPGAWLYVVALNAERTRWRRERKDGSAPAVQTCEPDRTGTVLTSVLLRDAIDRLSPRQRAAVVLRYAADLTVGEIALAMDCAEGTVKATLHQALRALRVDLGGDEL